MEFPEMVNLRQWTTQNVIQSLKSDQQFDYLFKCAGLKLIACWDLKEHRMIIIIIKNYKGKISIQFPESHNFEKSYLTILA